MSIDPRLLELIICPVCKGPLVAVRNDAGLQALACRPDRLAFPVRDGLPLMLESEAQPYDPDAVAPPVMFPTP